MSLSNIPSDILHFENVDQVMLKKWLAEKTFQQSLDQTRNSKPFIFYDGPPFATGLPHYGHILAGTIKDVLARYKTMNGYYVERIKGWDCHGVPIENEIQNKLGIKSNLDIEKLGIPLFNKNCRDVVMRCADDWKDTENKLARWIDSENDYKTLDTNYMESVWWVFSEIYKKGLVYRGFKVMPYSCGLSTCLSNFEAGENYKDLLDPSVTIKFKLKTETTKYLLVWTTTPWTLPSNMAVCTNENLDLVEIIIDGDETCTYITTENFVNSNHKITIKNKMKGGSLKGIEYEPLFKYFPKMHHLQYTILLDPYVDNSGTGFVHLAPAFGEDDYRVCLKHKLINNDGTGLFCPVDDGGKFINIVLSETNINLSGVFVKDVDCNKSIIKELKQLGNLFDARWETHSYPFCGRTNMPLIYKAVSSWFIKVEAIKEQLLENNKKTYWVPNDVGANRFHNWLEDARDWAVSRSRYWGTTIPIWANADFTEIVVINSIAQLEQLSGVRVNDLHRENIDHITFEHNGHMLKRIPEVFDCWFESGSMPYAKVHYPFSVNDIDFNKSFPADFISEGLDQTRGWFYTLMVISTALFNKPPFKNVIVNGLVLTRGPNGKTEKMSKRKKNYTDPLEIVKIYGADALRLYLLGSPAVKANPLVFDNNGVRDMVRDFILPMTNAYRFFVECYMTQSKRNQNINVFDIDASTDLDRWILSLTQTLIDKNRLDLEKYQLDSIVKRFVNFLELLNNWYIKLNREHLRGKFNIDGHNPSLATLFNVLYRFVLSLAPFAPFYADFLYDHLKVLLRNRQCSSVHLHIFDNEHSCFPIDNALEMQIQDMINVINLIRFVRSENKLSQKIPLRKVIVCNNDITVQNNINKMLKYILNETNIKSLEFGGQADYFSYEIKPINSQLGKKFGKDRLRIVRLINSNNFISHEQVRMINETGVFSIGDVTVSNYDIEIVPKIVDLPNYKSILKDNMLVLIDITPDEELLEEYHIRLLGCGIQQMRKHGGLHPWNPIEIYCNNLQHLIEKHEVMLRNKIGYPIGYCANFDNIMGKMVIEESIVIGDSSVVVRIYGII